VIQICLDRYCCYKNGRFGKYVGRWKNHFKSAPEEIVSVGVNRICLRTGRVAVYYTVEIIGQVLNK
jgi:hypothetical protein